MTTKYNIGVDLGGTNVKVAIVDYEGHIVYSNSVPTRAEMGYEYTISNIIAEIQTSLKETQIPKGDIGGIGFGLPGQVDYEKGFVHSLPNIPGWMNVPLGQIMEDKFGLPTKADNDVNVATLGEFAHGAGKGAKDVVCITVGTGIGAGIIANGQMIRGASMAAGELGHMILKDQGGDICGCGQTGCLETLASGPSIVKLAHDYVMGGKSCKFKELAINTPITSQIVGEAANMGDAVSKRIFEIIGYWIGIALANTVNLLNPEKIVIGGGVAQAGDILFNPIRETVQKRSLKVAADAVEIVPAQLGESAGVVGASILANSNLVGTK